MTVTTVVLPIQPSRFAPPETRDRPPATARAKEGDKGRLWEMAAAPLGVSGLPRIPWKNRCSLPDANAYVILPVFGVLIHGPSSFSRKPFTAAYAWNGATM